ncbi:hypothetical protein BCD67_08030 [Oscillatoriales cyanobacterium USR001]|nr:hypothetical protein BCD67_08030 [Oscillatoriales cyanobacterium USR001]
MELTVKDFEKVQVALSEAHLDYQLELVDGEIHVMGLSDVVSSYVIAQLARLLGNWVVPRRLGFVLESSGGFILPNTNLRGPDVSFVSAVRLPQLPRSFANIVPDLIVEVKSATDRLKPTREKIQMFLSLGVQVGILVDPDRKLLEVYRQNQELLILNERDILTIPELLEGWELAVSELWPPVFDRE